MIIQSCCRDRRTQEATARFIHTQTEGTFSPNKFSRERVNMPQVEMLVLVAVAIWTCVYGQDPASKVVSDRYAVYWNRTNPR